MMEPLLGETPKDYAERIERIALAALAVDRDGIVLSSPTATPMFVWSKQAFDGPVIKVKVEAGGNNPYRVLAGWPLPMSMLTQVPGRPDGYGYCWLVVVQIRARNV
jgi:hypothetical protein